MNVSIGQLIHFDRWGHPFDHPEEEYYREHPIYTYEVVEIDRENGRVTLQLLEGQE